MHRDKQRNLPRENGALELVVMGAGRVDCASAKTIFNTSVNVLYRIGMVTRVLSNVLYVAVKIIFGSYPCNI